MHDGTLGRSCHRTCPAGRRPSCTCGHAPDRTCCPIGAGRFVFAAATADRLASRCELLVCPDQVASTGEGWPAHRGGAWPGPWLRRTDHDQGRSALRPADRSAGVAQELVPHDRYHRCFNPIVRSTRRSSPPVRCSMTSTSAANAKHYVGSSMIGSSSPFGSNRNRFGSYSRPMLDDSNSWIGSPMSPRDFGVRRHLTDPQRAELLAGLT